MALGGDLDSQFQDAVLANRPFDDLQVFYNSLAYDFSLPVADIQRRWPDTLIGVSSNFFSYILRLCWVKQESKLKAL